MKRLLLLTLLLTIPKAFADFDLPVFKNWQMMEDSEVVEDEKVRMNCYLFKNYIILEKEEPGFLGKTLYYKENKILKKTAPESYCKDIKVDTFKKLDSSGASFYGSYKHLLFVQDPDELSARTKFEVYNLETGVLTYSGIKNNNTQMKIIPMSLKTTALEYYQRYLVDCDFNSDKMHLRCWNDFLASIEVPAAVKVPYPNCPRSKNPKKLQIFLKVQVADVQKSKRTFLWSKPICEIAP
ncbi:MAG: hypothetical protein JNL11_04630 [Bdellovibrionaceae bacterium]|nr:hypothetical protein [Pseudobdellovibrionaceae bacterium]